MILEGSRSRMGTHGKLVLSPAARIISKSLKRLIAQKVLSNTSVFLVGSSTNATSGSKNESIREFIKRRIQNYIFNKIDIYYPEIIFDELVYQFDLLDLENLLANSVDAVVIVLESPGAIAELGAFSNNDKFSNKLVVVIDKKYKSEKSFIMHGPIRYLKKKTNSRIIFHDFESPDAIVLIPELQKAISAIKRSNKKSKLLINPIELQFYFLSLFYLFEKLTKDQFDALITESADMDSAEVDGTNGLISFTEKEILKLRTASLSILIKNGEIQLSEHSYCLTQRGMQRFLVAIYGAEMSAYIDIMRIDVLNLKRRRMHLFKEVRGQGF